MMPDQLARYNDTKKDAAIAEGQVVFLQPKRNRSHSARVHVVKPGETLWGISQQRGIKMRKIAELNGITPETPLRAGQQLRLQKPRKP
jgi:LysM repeat protein